MCERSGCRSLKGIIPTFLVLLSIALGNERGAPASIARMKNPVTSSPELLEKVQATYEKNCLRCHGAGGTGDGPAAATLPTRPRNFTDTKQMATMTDGQLYWAITKGTQWMPAFEKKLPDLERWRLVCLLRALSKTRPNATVQRENRPSPAPPGMTGQYPFWPKRLTAPR